MGQEELGSQQPDCPYPAFEEISIEQIEQGTILNAPTLIDYFFHVISEEMIRIDYNALKLSLIPACMYILSLLHPGEYVPHVPKATEFLAEIRYEQSEMLMNYSDSAFPPDSLSYFEALAFMHGGFVGLNEAHFEVLAQLAMRAHMTCRGIVLGIERDEYLQTKGRDTLRPWPLIVTVSLYAHLAKIYRIPLRIFIMPVPPRSSAEYNTHYNAIYKQILKKNPKTTLVTTPRDPFRKKKYQRMKAVGLTPYDWEWTDIDFILSASTGVILGDREKIYRSLFPRLESQDFLTHFLSLKYWKTLRALY